MNASGGSEAAVTVKTSVGWIKFKECVKLLDGKTFSLKMKEFISVVYGQPCCTVVSHGVSRENEVAILRGTEKEMWW